LFNQSFIRVSVQKTHSRKRCHLGFQFLQRKTDRGKRRGDLDACCRPLMIIEKFAIMCGPNLGR
jgi:hypothetical protein